MKLIGNLSPKEERQVEKICKDFWGITQFNYMWTREDLEQEATIVIWQAKCRGKAIRYDILHNRVLDALRRHQMGGRFSKINLLFEITQDGAWEPEHREDHQIEARDFLCKLEAQLTAEENQLAYEFWLAGKSPSQIARELGLSDWQVRTRLLRIVKKAESLRYGNANIQNCNEQRRVPVPIRKSRTFSIAARC